MSRSKQTASAAIGAALLATVLLQATAQAGQSTSIEPSVTPNAV